MPPGTRCSALRSFAVEIRLAHADDVPAIRAIVEAAYAPYLPRVGRAPAPVAADYSALVAAGEAWVGVQGVRVIGVLVIRSDGDALHLENVAVEPAVQGRGHGRALIAFAERHARELGLAEVTLYTNEAMVENLRLYPRLGFVETDRRVEDGYRRVFFRKILDAQRLPS
jgi:ribosomal protein S18 acetylase RimI-like enzyme